MGLVRVRERRGERKGGGDKRDCHLIPNHLVSTLLQNSVYNMHIQTCLVYIIFNFFKKIKSIQMRRSELIQLYMPHVYVIYSCHEHVYPYYLDTYIIHMCKLITT